LKRVGRSAMRDEINQEDRPVARTYLKKATLTA
jgi:hypothetical protein